MDTYEKKYKEALERAKEIIECSKNSGAKEVRMVLSFFPELAESEDERIRQLLIRFVAYDMSDNYSDDFTPADCVAWLEKQGKNNMGISEATKQKLEGNLNKALEKETPETWNKFLEKQGEQKPADLNIKAGNWYVCDVEVINENMVTAFHRDEIYYCPKDGYLDVCGALFEVGCLDVFRLATEKEIPQPKQEWSEEDENILNTIINHFKRDIECTDEDDVIRWLKSLRPQSTWKPSDEQMDALKQMFSIGDKHSAEIVASLYEDLKKLREE